MSREAAVLLVDRIRCDGYGMCAELLPELMELDDWGFPILRSETVPPHLVDHARRAVEVCPVVALRLEQRAMPFGSGGSGSRSGGGRRRSGPGRRPTARAGSSR